MASNYDDVLGQLRAFGLILRDLVVGKMQRCLTEGSGREKNGWYVLHEMRLDSGDDLLVGSFGIWQGNENNAQKVEIRKTAALTSAQRAALRDRMKQDRRRAELELQRIHARAAEKAAAAWRKCEKSGEHEYLQRKNVLGHGVGFTPKGALVIPMTDAAGKVHGLQVIRAKSNAAGHPEKQYWPEGLNKKGHFHLIGPPPGDGPLLIAEGYATAASLFQALGLPVAVAFDANNLIPVAKALRQRYKPAKILLCADDDNTQRCHHAQANDAGKRVETCKSRVWLPDGTNCPHCGNPHKGANAGVTAASAAALAVGGAWITPQFDNPESIRRAWLEDGKKFNDFNDLHARDGLQAVRAQIHARLLELNWLKPAKTTSTQPSGGRGRLRPFDNLDELLERFYLMYEHGDGVFDAVEHTIIPLGAMRNACLGSDIYRAWMEHPDRKLVRVEEVGFDPTGKDPNVLCNLWAGWPTAPSDRGDCISLLDLLAHMCGNEQDSRGLFDWVIKWLAYPIQNPGAKMRTTIVVHGPQGTGKNMFFETVLAIYGRYGRILDQSALEDKFNDWASRKLFLIADEVVARSDLFHVKNKLKAFITGDRIRINPKNMAAYEEKNHVNMVFLSNESMPVVLEKDDRRHAVIWTPAKLDQSFYAKVKWEIENGGAAALHDYLLHVPLGDFHEGTLPPMTDAKRSLIDLSKNSPSKFWDDFTSGNIDGFPAANQPALLLPALSTELYDLYKHWAQKTGERALALPRFVDELVKSCGVRNVQKRFELNGARSSLRGMLDHDSGHQCPTGESEPAWRGHRIDIFRGALKNYINGKKTGEAL